MNFKQIFIKIYLKCIKIVNKRKYLIYHGNFSPEIIKSKRVIFFLDYPSAIHFGDTLWFEPICRLFAMHYSIFVCANPSIEFYFKKLGYKLISKEQIKSDDFIISRREVAYYLRKYDRFLINFIYDVIDDKLIDKLIYILGEQFKIDSSLIGAQPLALNYSKLEQLELIKRFNIKIEEKYIIFNNYIDSYKPRTRKSQYIMADEQLIKFVEKYKIEHKVKVIYTASKKDILKKNVSYSFVDIDLRGQTSIEDVFKLVSMPQIANYIGYDTFWMHVFNLYDKNSYIKLKPGFNENYNNHVKKYVAIPYSNAKSEIVFIGDALLEGN